MTNLQITEADGSWASAEAKAVYESYAQNIREVQELYRSRLAQRCVGLSELAIAEMIAETQQALSGDLTIAHCLRKMADIKGMYWVPVIVVDNDKNQRVITASL